MCRNMYTIRSKGDLKSSIPKVYVMINSDHQLYKILESSRRLEISTCLPMGDYLDLANSGKNTHPKTDQNHCMY